MTHEMPLGDRCSVRRDDDGYWTLLVRGEEIQRGTMLEMMERARRLERELADKAEIDNLV